MKKSIILFTLPLLLTSCESNTPYDNYRRQLVVTAIDGYSGRVRVTDSLSSVPPFDTSVVGVLYSRPDNLTTFSEDFDYNIKKYHALFDRHYSYTIDGEAVNNVKTINDSFGSGRAIKVDDVLFETLQEAIEFTKESDGLFNIAVGSLANLWASQIDLAQRSNSFADESYEAGHLIYTDPSSSAIHSATVCTPSLDIIDEVLVLDSKNKTVTFNSFEGCNQVNQKAELTFGAVGKGKATDLFASLYPNMSMYINAGRSSIKTLNYKEGQSPWSLQIANPLYNEKVSVAGDENIAAAYFKVNDSEVYFEKGGNFNFTTSGYYNNYYVSNATNEIRSHIVNPLTSYSVNSFDAVSVFTKDATYGDMYSTALSNTSSIAEAQALLAKLDKKFKQDAEAYYIVRENGKEIYYVPESLKDLLKLKDPKEDNLKYDMVSEIRVIGQ